MNLLTVLPLAFDREIRTHVPAHNRIGQGDPLQPGNARSHPLADEKRDQRQDQGRERGELDQMREWHCRPIPP